MSQTTLRKYQMVVYDNGRGQQYSGYVRTIHRDGTVSVEPMFALKNGAEVGCCQGGFAVRMMAEKVAPFKREA